MSIPQIVQGSMVQTPTSGVKIDSGAFRQAALAPGQVGAAIGQGVGGFFQDVSEKIQANKNAGTIFRADLAMRKTKDDFTAQLVTMPDPTTWVPAWNQQTKALRESIIDGPNVGPDVKRHLGRMMDTWEQATTSETKIAALLKQNANTREDAVTDATYIAAHATSDEHLETAKAIYDHAVDVGAMSRSDADKRIAKLPNIAAQSMADTLIANDAIHAPEKIKKFESMMEPRSYLGVVRHANEAMHQTQANNLQNVLSEIGSSPDGTYDMTLLKQKRDTNEITEAGYKSAVSLMDKSRLQETKSQTALGRLEAYDHDWENDKTPEATALALKDKYGFLPEANRLSLYKEIDGHMEAAKKQGEKAERPVERDMLQMMREDREQNHVTVPLVPQEKEGESHFFKANDPASTVLVHPGGVNALSKMTDEEFKDQFGDKVTRKQVMDAEQLHYAEMQQKMRSWFRDPANKDATVEQANQFRQSLEKPFVMQAVKQSLTKGHPVAVSTQEELDALEPGTPIIFNGRIGTKK